MKKKILKIFLLIATIFSLDLNSCIRGIFAFSWIIGACSQDRENENYMVDGSFYCLTDPTYSLDIRIINKNDFLKADKLNVVEDVNYKYNQTNFGRYFEIFLYHIIGSEKERINLTYNGRFFIDGYFLDEYNFKENDNYYYLTPIYCAGKGLMKEYKENNFYNVPAYSLSSNCFDEIYFHPYLFD